MLRTLSLLLAFAALLGSVHAQAYCALRDPNKQIFRLFPTADSYRSIVRTVDEDCRDAISERLPFTLHFNELGRHTVYVVQRKGQTLGIVHVRSEAGRWGLVEVAWALDLDMRVLDFEFQRCRDRSQKAFDDPRVRARIVGADFDQLRAQLDLEGRELAPKALPIDTSAAALGAVLVRNGLKTIAATESAWADDLWTLRAARWADELFPAGTELRGLDELHPPTILSALNESIGERGCGVVRETARAWDVLDEKGVWSGRMLVCRWRRAKLEADVWLLRDPAGTIAALRPRGKSLEPEVLDAFAAVLGKNRADLCGCAGVVELVALEGLITLDEAPAPRPRGR